MSREAFDQYLLILAVGCAIVAIVNLARVQTRGARALAMATACLAFGGAILSYRTAPGSLGVYLCGAVAVIGLISDFYLASVSRRKP